MGENMTDDVIQIQHKYVESLKIGHKIFKSAFDWELTVEDLEKAARELGETEEKKKKCLKKLKEKLSNESSIKYRQDDLYLLRFIRVRKYDASKAYQNMKLFWEQRRKHPEFVTLPPDLKSIQELNWVTILPYTDEEGRILFFLNFNKWNPEERSFEEVIQTSSAVCDIVSMNPKCQINGVIGIWNLSGITKRHVTELLWNRRLWAALSIQQNGYPWRINKIIILNTNRLVRFLFNIMRPLVQKKMAERIILLGSDVEDLHQHVNPALLPTTLKGTLEETECDLSQHLLDNLPYLRYERTFIYE